MRKIALEKQTKLTKCTISILANIQLNVAFDVFLENISKLIRIRDFGTVKDGLLKDRIMMGTRDEVTKNKLLSTRKLNPAKVIDICLSEEAKDSK